jgi:NAD(P)-dependent dehydrogenase (short-subunit alcohol dehydrogenase family)
MIFEDKNAVIYGGGGAIGGAMARVFATEGARVFLAGRTKAKLDAVAADIAAAGGQAETTQVDALDQGAVDEHADAVVSKVGGIDIAVHAMSVIHDQGTVLADLTLDEFMRPIDGFQRTLFITTKTVARHMGGARPGVIITLSEPGAKVPIGGILGHAAPTRTGRRASLRLVHEGAVRAGRHRARPVGRGVDGRARGHHHAEAPTDSVERRRDGGVPRLRPSPRHHRHSRQPHRRRNRRLLRPASTGLKTEPHEY